MGKEKSARVFAVKSASGNNFNLLIANLSLSTSAFLVCLFFFEGFPLFFFLFVKYFFFFFFFGLSGNRLPFLLTSIQPEMALKCGTNVFIVAAKRTAFGSFGGSLKDFTATDLSVFASQAAIAASGVSADQIDNVIIGNVAQSSTDAPYLSRHVGLRSGVPVPSPALTLNRLCGSGFQAVVSGASDIILGSSRIALVGGTESMSQAPHVARGIRFGTALGVSPVLEDTLWAALTDSYAGLKMGETAENLAVQYGLSRADCDAYALQTQQRWAAAHKAGKFAAEIAPVTLKSGKKKGTEFIVDEHPRPESTPESLAKLPSVFKKDGTVTPGNASGISDGAASLILASEEAVKEHKLTPLARIIGWGNAGCDPKVMGIGPVPAMQRFFQASGLSVDRVDLFDINEAFAPQFLAVQKELGLPNDKTNINGGAIALGHPLGASGARIVSNLVHTLSSYRSGAIAVGGACIGGGSGIVVGLEKC